MPRRGRKARPHRRQDCGIPTAGGVAHCDKLRTRKSIDFAIVGLGSRFQVSSGASLGFGGRGPGALRAEAAEEQLKRKKVDEALIEGASDLAVEAASVMRHNKHKLHYMKHLLREAIRRAACAS